MKIIEIGCSTEGNSDGIGKHARIVSEEMNRRKNVIATLISGNTIGFSRKQMIFSMEMCNAFKKAEKLIESEHYDYVVVEYPFSEYNPFIVIAYQKLKKCCHKNACRLVLSMHEYDRVNELRRMVVKNFVKNADIVYVSDPIYLEKLKKYNDNLNLRIIPNHIPIIKREKSILSKNRYVYFGLVNNSKAFNEMLAAWDLFNKDLSFSLDIVTATEIIIDEKQHKNIKIHVGLNNEDSADIMWNAMFSIVPVKPEVGFNNSSFVSSIQCGCIPIGHFSNRLKKESFIINTECYDLEEFVKTLNLSTNLSEENLLIMSRNALEFGKNFTIGSTVDMMLSVMKDQN